SEDGDLYKLCFDKQSDEMDWIVNKVNEMYGKEYNDKGTLRKLRYSDMVLLFRKRSFANEYKEALENAGIRVIYSGLGGLMESQEIDSLLRIFQFIGESVHDKKEPNESFEDVFLGTTCIFAI